MSEYRSLSDDLPALLLLVRVVEAAASAQAVIPGVPESALRHLLAQVRADVVCCTRDEFDGIVFWLTPEQPGGDQDAGT